MQYPVIKLGDQLALTLHPQDPDACNAVDRISKVMCLQSGMTNNEIFIGARKNYEKSFFYPTDNPNKVCIIPEKLNETLQIIQMSIIGQCIALQTLPYSGILLHGALIEKNGIGIVLAAPSGTGKTTASLRVKPPWIHVCDDTTLIIPDFLGNYFAYPWPTWSRFYNNGPGGCWNVQKSVFLRGIYFLRQSEENKIEPIDISHAISYLIESIHQAMNFISRDKWDGDELKKIYQMELSAASVITKNVPVNILNINLTGPFWEKIEEAIQNINPKSCRTSKEVHIRNSIKNKGNNTSDKNLTVIYSGNAMFPTLKEPELLKIESYLSNIPRIGDIICYFSVEKHKKCIRRVINIKQGIIISGDNPNISEKIYILPEQILGKAVFSFVNNKKRRLIGGYSGFVLHHMLKLCNITSNSQFKLYKDCLYQIKNIFFKIITKKNPRLIIFYKKNKILSIRLYVKNLFIAEYHFHRNQWIIKYPYSLWIDKKNLPDIIRKKRI